MKTKMMILSLFISASAVAAIPKTMQGTVTLKIDSANAQITTKNVSLKEGDRVGLYKEVCQGPKVRLCHNEKVGTGVVSRVITQDASEIKIEGNAQAKEGLMILKE
ncbi:hypothetical protein [Bdellovibrio svalbardensis]|uniref:Uncharacterized protein n=1 Tax=Bdellovibrio svalbardensis TaxID=2972972 RepID=A0ABT6DL48_9BACT|nr:hypothetical protein [Bdellovibrio svalbardensis]MDG0817299.1 hypothetical protein [Bdellovibrio svalbardensis]